MIAPSSSETNPEHDCDAYITRETVTRRYVIRYIASKTVFNCVSDKPWALNFRSIYRVADAGFKNEN